MYNTQAPVCLALPRYFVPCLPLPRPLTSAPSLPRHVPAAALVLAAGAAGWQGPLIPASFYSLNCPLPAQNPLLVVGKERMSPCNRAAR